MATHRRTWHLEALSGLCVWISICQYLHIFYQDLYNIFWCPVAAFRLFLVRLFEMQGFEVVEFNYLTKNGKGT